MTRWFSWAFTLLVAGILAVACSQAQPSAKLEVKVPWPDRELTQYVITDGKGAEVGAGELEVSKEDDRYLLRHNYRLGAVVDAIAMRVRADDLKPLSEQRLITTDQGVTEIRTSYEGAKLSIYAKTPDGKEQSATIDVPEDAYDNSEALFLWRALPFQQGYKVSYTNIVAANALKPRVTITVVGQEKISVPAGEFEAWHLELEAAGQKQQLWYAVAAPHYLLKYDNGSTVFLLRRAA